MLSLVRQIGYLPVIHGSNATLQRGFDNLVIIVRVSHTPPELRGNGNSTHDALTDAFVGDGDCRSDGNESEQLRSRHGLPTLAVPHDGDVSVLKDNCVEMQLVVSEYD